MPWSFKRWLNASKTNSPPLSHWNKLILKLDCTCALNFSKDSPLDYNAYNHIFFRKSLMEVIQYLALPTDVVLMGHTCMNVWFPKACSLAPPSPSFGNATLCCLSSIHASQSNDDVGARMVVKVHATHYILKHIYSECPSSSNGQGI